MDIRVLNRFLQDCFEFDKKYRPRKHMIGTCSKRNSKARQCHFKTCSVSEGSAHVHKPVQR
jgi:hypothetical protein